MGYQELTDDNGDYVGETYFPDEWDEDESRECNTSEKCIPEEEFEY